MKERMAAMIYACKPHAARITQLLDEAGVTDWSVVPAVQERRMGFLQSIPPLHAQGCSVIFACADAPTMARALEQLATAEDDGSVCPDCVVHTWKVRQARLAAVALDIVCDTVVDRTASITAEYEGRTYYFCCEMCRDSFNKQPDVFIHLNRARKIGHREVTPGNNGKTHQGDH